MRPPKIAMVVANFITGDSRVQKAARWAASAGWDVTLIGRSKTGQLERFTLGRANVTRVPVRDLANGDGDWRQRALFADYERFESILDELRPDLIHAHDINMLGIAVRAKRRARLADHDVKVIYDAHEYVAGLTYVRPSWRLAMLADEYEYIAEAEAVMTVTEPLAEALCASYGLRELPAVVKNAPECQPLDVEADAAPTDIRADCGLAPDIPLIVYSGWVIAERGLATVVAALPQLPDVHFAIQASDGRRCRDLLRDAAALGVGDRLHVLPYVAAHQVSEYLRTATAGVLPPLRTEDDGVGFHTKYFEYMHARLPIVTSDVELHAEMTGRLGNGEVFTAGDVDSLVSATRAVVSDHDRYIAAYAVPGLLESNSWEAQVPALLDLYSRVTGMRPSRLDKLRVARASRASSDMAMDGAERMAESAGSAAYWEDRYRSGGTSGAGSYGRYAELSSEIINQVIRERGIEEVVEYGCGDGNQVAYLRVPKYIGLDVAPTAIKRCTDLFRDDQTKSFFLCDPEHRGDAAFSADCALSKEVIFHLVEDDVFERYMRRLFSSARRFVVIVSSDMNWSLNEYERHRRFTPWIASHLPEWRLAEKVASPAPYNFETGEGILSNFYVFHRERGTDERVTLR
jgi:glycosyltransferase involved in cell wall biosynthesis